MQYLHNLFLGSGFLEKISAGQGIFERFCSKYKKKQKQMCNEISII